MKLMMMMMIMELKRLKLVYKAIVDMLKIIIQMIKLNIIVSQLKNFI